MKKYQITAYPTMVYLDGSGKVLMNTPGAPMGESFGKQIEQLGGGR